MTLELEQAIENAQNNSLQEAVIQLCEAVKQLQDEISYLQNSMG